MSNPTTTPTIAELWREFSIYDHLDHFYNPETYAGSDLDREYFEGQLAKREALRAELLERCARVEDVDQYYTRFTIEHGYLHSWLMKWDNTRTEQTRTDNAETSKEYAAACAFWAWELEQQQRERDEK